jgi:hypothetical protein
LIETDENKQLEIWWAIRVGSTLKIPALGLKVWVRIAPLFLNTAHNPQDTPLLIAKAAVPPPTNLI